jgi:hypothetical protein
MQIRLVCSCISRFDFPVALSHGRPGEGPVEGRKVSSKQPSSFAEDENNVKCLDSTSTLLFFLHYHYYYVVRLVGLGHRTLTSKLHKAPQTTPAGCFPPV